MIYRIFSVLTMSPILLILYPVLGLVILFHLYILSIKVLCRQGVRGLVYNLQVLKAQIEEVTNNVD